MTFAIICFIIFSIITAITIFLLGKRSYIIGLISLFIINSLIAGLDFKGQTYCEEVWNGSIVDVHHEEEYDEFIPEKGHTDEEGNYIVDKPAYWEHHNAENKIKTSDDGWNYVYKTIDGEKFTDSFVNSDKELEQYYKIGTTTSSIHSYENRIQASYSIYKHKDIDLDDYPNLPNYPNEVNNFKIDKFIGEVNNKDICLELINEWNTKLNDTNNSNNIDNIKSYKQVNIIFVNLGNVSEDYGYALQDYWNGGNKNDFIICFGSKDNKIIWCNSFSWCENELLKQEINDYILDKSNLNNFEESINYVCSNIEQKFERKQFSDFNYIQIEIKTFSKILIVILDIIMCILLIKFSIDEKESE